MLITKMHLEPFSVFWASSAKPNVIEYCREVFSKV